MDNVPIKVNATCLGCQFLQTPRTNLSNYLVLLLGIFQQYTSRR